MIGFAIPTVSSAVATLRAIEWPIRRLGPYSSVLGFVLLGIVSLGVSRAILIGWQWDRVAEAGQVPMMMLQGLRSDLIVLGLFVALPVTALPLALLTGQLKIWSRITAIWLTVSLVFIVFMELATPQFLIEYDSRPNRLFVEYLVYPREVLGMLWSGYRTLLAVTVLSTVALSWAVWRHFRKCAAGCNQVGTRTVLLWWPVVMVVLFIMIRSTAQHRAVNLATFSFCDDALVNSLVANSAYSVLTAVYSLRNEAQSSEQYGKMPLAEMIQRSRFETGAPAASFFSEEFPTLHRQVASVQRSKPLNLVIVLEESVGAGFVGKLGGVPITPTFDRLADEGIWFDQLYATGTRSVRGIEAVVAGFPPTPALSVVKLSKSQKGFATLASVLRKSGYRNEFIYGGESHFDNMRGFFLGNGFHTIVDRGSFAAPKFVGSWGVSDEDLFEKAHERIQSLNGADAPFFMLVFSSTNHTPFEFPDAPFELVDKERQTVNNAVKYADYALGQFLDHARGSDYWKDTLFLVVADHDTRVYGDELVPVSKFHIPGVILGADVAPRRIGSLASQIDLAPTLLSLLGVDSEHPFPGRDLTRTLPEFGNSQPSVQPRAIMQFDQNFAWLEDNRLTVLLPDGKTRHLLYDPHTRHLGPSTDADPETDRRALSNVLMSSWLYQQRKYRLAD
jgi:phosphoglycerol transferase MdoB-like AlkP superfamily enzyme